MEQNGIARYDGEALHLDLLCSKFVLAMMPFIHETPINTIKHVMT